MDVLTVPEERYVLGNNFLGEGSYGKVYKAYDKILKKDVAIKKMKINKISSCIDACGINFIILREIKIMKEIKHENIMAALDLYSEKEYINLVMEIMDSDLSKLINRKIFLNGSQQKCILWQILNGLHVLHKYYFMHRDLSPANIFLNKNGEVKIADFGLSAKFGFDMYFNRFGNDFDDLKYLKNINETSIETFVMKTDSDITVNSDKKITTEDYNKQNLSGKKEIEKKNGKEDFYSNSYNFTNKVVTLWYRAPELLLGSTKYTAAIDMWSYGCICAELILQKALFPGENEIDQLGKIFHLLGTPDTDNWPQARFLPLYTEFTKAHKQDLKNVFKNTDQYFTDFVSSLLKLNPHERMTAEEALKHPYFCTDPLPCKPKQLPFDNL